MNRRELFSFLGKGVVAAAVAPLVSEQRGVITRSTTHTDGHISVHRELDLQRVQEGPWESYGKGKWRWLGEVKTS